MVVLGFSFFLYHSFIKNHDGNLFLHKFRLITSLKKNTHNNTTKRLFFQKYFLKNQQLFRTTNAIFSKKKNKNQHGQNLFKIIVGFKLEKIIEISNINLKLSFFFTLVGILDLFVEFYANKQSKKIKLPDEYDFEKIILYFKLKPEITLNRFIQIWLKILKLSLASIFNFFFFYQKNTSYIRKKKKNTKLVKICTKNQKNIIMTIRLKNMITCLIICKKKKHVFYRQNVQIYNIRQLCNSISVLSPVSLKLVQLFGSNLKIIDDCVIKELYYLQNNLYFFSNKIAFDFIKKELKLHSSDIFFQIVEFPIISTNFSQTYKASTNKTRVTIKIQRPELTELIALDIMLIRFVICIFQKILNIKNDLTTILDEYAYCLFEELDYRKEIIDLLKFQSLCGYMNKIHVPKIFLRYSSRYILVTEWTRGYDINSNNFLQKNMLFSEIGVRYLLFQLLNIGFLYSNSCKENSIKIKKSKISFFDFIPISEIPLMVKFSLMIFFIYLINQRYKILFTDLIFMQHINKEQSLLKFDFIFLLLFDFLTNSDYFVSKNTAKRIFQSIIKYPFVIFFHFLTNLKSIAILEKIIRTNDLTFKIDDMIYFYIINRVCMNIFVAIDIILEDLLLNDGVYKVNWNKIQFFLQNLEQEEIFFQYKNLSNVILFFLSFPYNNFSKKISWLISHFFFTNIEYTHFCKFSVANFYKNKTNVFDLVFLESTIYNIKILILLLEISFLYPVLFFFIKKV